MSAAAQISTPESHFGLPDCGRSDIGAKTHIYSASPRGGKDLIAEVTWDLVMSDDMPFVEGCYCLDGGEWQVVTARKSDACRSVQVRNGVRWDSGATGINIVFPSDATVSRLMMLNLMTHELGVTEGHEVRGPNSIMLR
jgi:hypothetical protein